MSLADWQRNLGRMMTAPHRTLPPETEDAPPFPMEGELSPDERRWLDDVHEASGLFVTRLMQRRARRRRILDRVRLTAAALRRAGELSRVDDYMDETPMSSLSAEIDALRFLAHVLHRSVDPLATSLARFERALTDSISERGCAAAWPTSVPLPTDALLYMHPWRIVELPAPADDIICALALGQDFPVAERCSVIVGPRIPTLWRPATRHDEVLCMWLLARPKTYAELMQVFPTLAPSLRTLVAEGVVAWRRG